MPNIIFPVNPLGRGYDDAFTQEVSAVNGTAGVELGHVDHDVLSHYHEVKFRISHFPETKSLYRGWMLTVDDYRLLCNKAEVSGVPFLTSPEQYAAAHNINGWLDAMSDVTFPTILVPADSFENDILAAVAGLEGDSFFIKDYVKSRKDDPELSVVHGRENLHDTIQRFVEAQEEWLVGGIAIRQFVPLAENRVEVRAWWRNGEWKAFTTHPDYADRTVPEVPQGLLKTVSDRLTALGVYFVSADFAETANGDWVLIEIGDGQVSGFPGDIDDDTIVHILVD
jgi:hypothetical protein